MGKSDNGLKDQFTKARKDTLFSGCLKFSTEFISTFDLYKAALAWAESDKRVKALSIRGGGSNQNALDFRFDMEGATEKELRGETLRKVFFPFFEEYFEEGCIEGWDYSNGTVTVLQEK